VQWDDGGAEGAAALLPPALDAVAGSPRGRFEAHRALGLLALQGGDLARAATHFHTCLDDAGTLGDQRLAAFARRCLDRTRGTGRIPAGWTEVRPGAWRLADGQVL
jgi:hypothetical protein